MGYKEQFQSYMEEVEAYLAKVRKGRRVPAADPQAPQYSQGADDLRLIRQGEAPAGYGQTGRVPAPTAPPSSPPETFDPRGFGQAFATPGGESPKYGFTERPKPETTKVLGGVADSVMNDPRMAAFGGGSVSTLGGFRPSFQELANNPNIKALRNTKVIHPFERVPLDRQAYMQDVTNANRAAADLASSNPELVAHTKEELKRTSSDFQKRVQAVQKADDDELRVPRRIFDPRHN
jgi:hypothetical protein